MNALNDNRPTPTLLTLADDAKRKLLTYAMEGRERLNTGDAIESLEYDQVLGLCIYGEAELATFVLELARRRTAMNN